MIRNTRMSNANRFKLGLFGFNCSSGLAMTKVPERWDASWDNCVAAARLAEAIGFEFALPVARWTGYGGETDSEGSAFETLTWAAGLLGATEELVAFGTLHVPLIHPIFAAKVCVTADHIGQGRFGLNVVSGWNAGEFEMFGLPLREHDERYAFTAEWIAIVKQLWEGPTPFDFKGRYFDLKGVRGDPKPWGGGRPLLMSAGVSPAGRAFAVQNVDCVFMTVVQWDNLEAEVAVIRAAAAARPTGIFVSGHVVCRPTQKEAEDYYHYYVHEMGDWAAVDWTLKAREQQHSTPKEHLKAARMIGGLGTFPMVGSPDHLAAMFKRMHDAGLGGSAIGFVNYLDELPYFAAEVLPRMARMGLRAPVPVAA